MQELLIYLLKSGGLITAFFLAYHFLLRKETFFTTNRWFLLTGLIASVVLPLFFIEQIVVVETPKSVSYPIINSLPNTIATNEIIEKSVEIDWFKIGIYVYGIIALLLLFKVIFNLISLFKVLDNKQVFKQDNFQFIDVNENMSPFSFFNYIVFNSSLYSESELQSILLHEKIHSAQKHSFDVLITNLFSVIFWFNPLMHFYKKAVIQNLEYIADSEAIAQIDDKKSYQMALLKVISHQNCLPITNHFYQSLIKKRIVMLNKNQSNKRNSWKYAVIIPALVAFVILFQVKVIAQEKEVAISKKTVSFAELISFTIDKNSSDAEMKENAKNLKKRSGIEVKFSKIKRNSKGEITAIKIDYKDQNGNKGTSVVNGDEPIDDITIFKTKNSVGIKSNESGIDRRNAITVNSDDEIASISEIDVEDVTEISSIDFTNMPTPPTPPIAPTINFEIAEFPNMPKAPAAPKGTPLNNEKEWKKFEKKMAEFEKKMEAMEPEIEAYAAKMANVDEQMKPFEKEMEAFEKKMEVFEKQMEEYQNKIEANNKKKQKE